VAGKGISKKLQTLVKNPNIQLVDKPSPEDLDILIRNMVETMESNASWIGAIRGSLSADFTETFIQQREKLLNLYNNQINAENLTALL
jgi:hypothetical protein